MIYIVVFFAQLVSSVLRSLSVHSVAAANRFNAVFWTMLSDAVFYAVVAGVVSKVASGGWSVIAAAVVGGAVGNWLAVSVCQIDFWEKFQQFLAFKFVPFLVIILVVLFLMSVSWGLLIFGTGHA